MTAFNLYGVVARAKDSHPWGVVTTFNTFFMGADAAKAGAMKAASGWSANLPDHQVRVAKIFHVRKRDDDPASFNAGQYCDDAMNSGVIELL